MPARDAWKARRLLAAVRLALAQEARDLRCERSSPEGSPPDSSSRSSESARCSSSSTYAAVSASRRQRTRHLLDGVLRVGELADVDLGPEDAREPVAEGARPAGLGARDT